jgi:hypothetical protein
MVCDGGSDVLAHDLVDIQHIQVDTTQLKHVRVACASIGKSLNQQGNNDLDIATKSVNNFFYTNF